jgi:hypothetical protein
MAFNLTVLVTEVVATLGLVVLEAFGRFTETLRSPTVGFQLGHDQSTPMATVRRLLVQPLPGEQRQATTACFAVTSFLVQTP